MEVRLFFFLLNGVKPVPIAHSAVVIHHCASGCLPLLCCELMGDNDMLFSLGHRCLFDHVCRRGDAPFLSSRLTLSRMRVNGFGNDILSSILASLYQYLTSLAVRCFLRMPRNIGVLKPALRARDVYQGVSGNRTISPGDGYRAGSSILQDCITRYFPTRGDKGTCCSYRSNGSSPVATGLYLTGDHFCCALLLRSGM